LEEEKYDAIEAIDRADVIDCSDASDIDISIEGDE
jgi:hypothetical protein